MMRKRTGNGCTHFLLHPPTETTPARLQEINFPLIPSEKLPSLQHSPHPLLPWCQTGGQGDTEVTHGQQAVKDDARLVEQGSPSPAWSSLLELLGRLNRLCSHLA